MNKLSVLFLVLAVTALGSIGYMFNEIAGLSSLVAQLKANKITLTDRNRRLEEKNRVLEKHQKKSRQLVRQHRTRTVNHTLERAAKKMARAGVAMIPVVGISAVVAATADDMHDLCSDIRAARELEKELVGENISISKEEDQYCHEYMASELAIMAHRQREKIATDFGVSYDALLEQADRMKESMNNIADGIVNAPYQDEFEKQYRYIVDYWSGKLNHLSDETPAKPKDLPALNRAEELPGEGGYEWMQGA